MNDKPKTNTYRLSTDTEWQYAEPAGGNTRFAQGYEEMPKQANISGKMTEMQLQQDRPNLWTLCHPVTVAELDTEKAWGIRHMSGNVSEVPLSFYHQKNKRRPNLGSISD
jgi:formylglycine-generating enzyme required for sulfatase activity